MVCLFILNFFSKSYFSKKENKKDFLIWSQNFFHRCFFGNFSKQNFLTFFQIIFSKNFFVNSFSKIFKLIFFSFFLRTMFSKKFFFNFFENIWKIILIFFSEFFFQKMFFKKILYVAPLTPQNPHFPRLLRLKCAKVSQFFRHFCWDHPSP